MKSKWPVWRTNYNFTLSRNRAPISSCSLRLPDGPTNPCCPRSPCFPGGPSGPGRPGFPLPPWFILYWVNICLRHSYSGHLKVKWLLFINSLLAWQEIIFYEFLSGAGINNWASGFRAFVLFELTPTLISLQWIRCSPPINIFVLLVFVGLVSLWLT